MNFGLLKGKLASFAATKDKRFPPEAMGDCLNLAMTALMRRHRTRYNEVTGSLSAVAGVGSYDLPPRWREYSRVYYLDPTTGDVKELDWYRTRSAIDADFPPNGGQDLPKAFTVWAGKVIVRPTPSTALALVTEYWETLEECAFDADTNRLIDGAWDVVLYRALADYASAWLQEDDRIAVWLERANTLEDDMSEDQSRSRNQPGPIQSGIPG